MRLFGDAALVVCCLSACRTVTLGSVLAAKVPESPTQLTRSCKGRGHWRDAMDKVKPRTCSAFPESAHSLLSSPLGQQGLSQ